MNEPADKLTMLRAINATAAFNRWLGLEVVAATHGSAEIRMAHLAEATQYAGFLHAGIVGGLLDTACGFAAATMAGRVLASHFSVNCLSPAVGRAFVARGRVVKAGKRQIFTQGELFAEDAGGKLKLIATGEALLLAVDG